MTDHSFPLHHFPEELLLDHAAGSLPEGLALIVAAHLALCPTCRATVADCEALGGALLAAIQPAPVAPDALDKVLARIDAEERTAAQPPPAPVLTDATLPRPLRGYVASDIDALPWRRRLTGKRSGAAMDLAPSRAASMRC